MRDGTQISFVRRVHEMPKSIASVWLFVLFEALTLNAQNPECRFVNSGSIQLGQIPTGVASADFDGDSDMDLAVALPLAGSVALLRNNGNAEFELFDEINVELQTLDLKFADMNGDLIDDLVLASPGPHTAAVLINDGNGQFAAPLLSAYDNHFPSPQTLDIGDLNADGILDIVPAGQSGPDPWEGFAISMLNDGTGQVAEVDFEYSGNTSIAGCRLADFDGDQDLDVVIVGGLFSGIEIRENDGHGQFEQGEIFSSTLNNAAVAVADFDGNSCPDFVVGHIFNSTSLSIYLNEAGTFLPPVPYQLNSDANCLQAADLDGDSFSDLIFVDRSENTAIFIRNDGAGNFLEPAVFPVGDSPDSIALSDLDGDGDLDAAIANLNSQDITILLNETVLHGDVNQDQAVNLLDVHPFVEIVQSSLYQIEADINCDGKVDLLDVVPFVVLLSGD